MSVYGHRCLGPKGLAKDCLGRMAYVYSERDIYNQMLYYQSLFDIERIGKDANGVNGVKVEGEVESREKMKVLAEVNRERLATLKEVVSGWLEKNGRQWVQMDRLFGFVAKRA